MRPDEFYPRIAALMPLAPEIRHGQMAQLHTEILTRYLAAIRAITPERSLRMLDALGDRRTLHQVVGHIMEWERFMILGAGDLLAGLRRPRMVLGLEGFVEPDGTTPAFQNIEAFNAYQARKHFSWPWAALHGRAVETAITLHALFTQPGLLTAERLERSERDRKRLPDGSVLENLGLGWILWIVALEHEGVEHAADLALAG